MPAALVLLAVRFGRWVSPGDENTSAFRLRGGRGIWRWRGIWRIWREAPAGPQAGGPRWRGIWRSPLEGLVLGLHWHTLHQIQIPRSSPTLLASVGLMSESPTVTESDSVMVNLNIMSRRYPSPGAGPSDSLRHWQGAAAIMMTAGSVIVGYMPVQQVGGNKGSSGG